jgi:hypothetical protein
MAKEFKNYDKVFQRGSDSDLSAAERLLANEITRWNLPVASWSPEQVREAVYSAPGYEDWQKFRVSLKGQSTKVKLFRLRQRFTYAIIDELPWWDRCRMDNYIGALKRGGQLGMDLEVRK